MVFKKKKSQFSLNVSKFYLILTFGGNLKSYKRLKKKADSLDKVKLSIYIAD